MIYQGANSEIKLIIGTLFSEIFSSKDWSFQRRELTKVKICAKLLFVKYEKKLGDSKIGVEISLFSSHAPF